MKSTKQMELSGFPGMNPTGAFCKPRKGSALGFLFFFSCLLRFYLPVQAFSLPQESVMKDVTFDYARVCCDADLLMNGKQLVQDSLFL